MDEFQIGLVASLDSSKSKQQLNSDIEALKKQLTTVEVQAKLGKDVVMNLTQQLNAVQINLNNVKVDQTAINNMISQFNTALGKVNINLGNINTNGATQSAQKTGQQIGNQLGNSINQSLQANLNHVKQDIQNIFSSFSVQKLNNADIFKNFNLNRAKIDPSVTKDVQSLTAEINKLAREALKTNSDSAWEGITQKISNLSDVLNKFGATRDLSGFKEQMDLLDYFQGKKIFVGDKAEAIQSTGMSIRELNNQFRNLGVTFTTVENGSTKLDEIWSELFNIKPNFQGINSFGDQINAVVNELKISKEAMYGDSNLMPAQRTGATTTYLNTWLEMLEKLSQRIEILKTEQVNLQNQMAQASNNATNAVVANQQKQQQAYQQTGSAIQAVTSNTSVIGNMPKEASDIGDAKDQLSQLLQNEKAVIATTQHFDNDGMMRAFTLNVKRATGEVESLNYAFREITDNNGNVTDTYFENTNSHLNDSGAIKQIADIEKAFSDYTTKIAKFKSTNAEILSGLDTPLKDFETKLAGLKTGASTVNEVKSALNSLNTEAAKITQNFSKQLSPIDRAVSKIANGAETIKGLRAELKGLDNAPKDLSKELNQCATALQKVKDIEAKEGRTENWSKAYKQWAESIDAVTAKIKTLKKEQSNVASTQVFNTSDLKANNVAYMSKVYNTIEKQMVEINRLANANGWSDVKVTGVEEASGKIQKLTLTVRDAEGALKQFNMQREKIQGNGKVQAGLVQTGDVKVLETAVQYAEKLKSIETSMGQFGNTTTSITNLENSFTKLGLSTDEVNSKMEAVKTEYATLQNMMSSGASGNEIVNQFEKVNSVLKETQNSLKQTKAEYSLLATEYQRLTLANDIEEWNQKNTAATREVIAQNERYISSLRDLDVAMTKVEHNNIATSFKQTENSMRALNKLGASFSNQFRQAIDSFKVWISATTVVMGAVNLIRQIPTVVNELDTALVDLRKTTTMTDAQLKEFYTDAPNIAKEMGVGTKAIIEQASAWSRLGYSSKNAATKMAKYSAMFKTISPGMSLDDATDGLVSVMKAFNIGNENVDDVVDGIMSKINVVGNTQAVDNSDIVDFLTRSSSAMAEANNTLEQTIALGTAATEITRSSDSVGNALKTISMRVRGYDEQTEAYTGDVEQLSGAIANLTKTAKTPGGISLFTDSSKQTFKSTYDLLKEISQIYSQLSDKNQAQLLEVLAGKRQGQIVASIIDNFSAAEKSMQSMANSAGNAQVEMDVAMDSIDAKANKLKQTGVAISENLLSRDNAKTVLEVANGIAEGFELATKHLGLFKTALLGLSVVGSVKNIGLFKTTKNDSETSLSGQKIVTAFTSRKIAQEEATKQTALDIECLQRYEAECQKGSVSTETFATTMKGASVEAQKYAVNIKNGTGSAQTFATNQKAIQTSVAKTGVASKVAAVGLNIFKTALNMGIMLGVSELITGVIELATYSDKLADSAQSLGNDFKDSETDISNYKDRIQELNDKINDSSTPYADVIQARKDLMTIQNEMIEKYGDEKGAIEDITNAVKGQADAFNNLNMTQYNKMVNDFNKTGGIVGKIQNSFAGSNFEQMKEKEKSYSDKIDMSYNSELDDYIKSLGAKQVISDRGSYFELNGTLQEVYESMKSIQEVANQLGEDKYANRLSDQINDAQELTDKYKDMYDAYVLYEQVLKDTDYSSAYQQAMSDYQNYQKQATENGLDSEEAKKASEQYAQNMSKAIQKALENGDNEVANYFESLYPDLQSIVETWKFKAKITPEWDNGSTNVNYDKETDKEMKEALSAFNNAEEIKNFNSDTATTEQKNAMTTLQKIAEQNFHNDIDVLVDAAIALYGLETQGEQDFIDKLNGKSLSNNKKKNQKRNQEDLTAGVSATMSNASKKVDNKTAKEFYNSLTSDEDKALVVSDDFNRVLAQQTGTLENGKYSVNSYTNALKQLKDAQDGANGSASELSISDSITKIDDLQTKMKDLDGIMADFVSGDGIDVSNLSGIVDSFQKMKDAGQDVDMTNVENAIKQISDASSLSEAQSALDSLCTEYVYASGVLDGLTDSNASLIAERLKGIGVANAEQIVEQQLEAQKLATKVETEGLTDATLAEIQAYMEEKGYSEQAQQALYQLLLTKIDIANNPINTASDIQQLINLANAAGTASNYVEKLQRLLNMMNGINTYTKAATDINDAKKQQLDEQAYYRHAEKQGKKSNGKYETVDEYALAKANEYAQAIKNVTQTKLNANDFITKPHYGGGSSTRKAQDKANKDKGSEKEPTKKDYDWIETLISRINRQVTNLGKAVSATYKTWSTRNNALAQELGVVNQQISAEQQAYSKYMQLANSVGLPEGYASLVRNGTIDVSTIQDDDLNDKIEKYRSYYESALSASDAIQDLQDKLAELAKTKFDNISSDFEAQIDQIKHSTTMYQSYIDQVEAEDAIPVRSYYENMIANEQQTIGRLKDEYSQLTNAMNEALNTGRIQAYSEEWYNMRASINSVDEAIQDANKSIIEYTKSMKELSKTKFNKISTAYENASGFNDHAKNMYNGLIDQADAEGRFASKDYYSALMDMEKLNIKTLTQESNDLHKSLQEAMNKGDIEEYSDDWYEMMGKINDVDEAIMDANKSLTEYGNSMRQLDWDLFDKQEDYISKIQEESDFLVDLMSNQKLYDDDTGKDTKYATAIKGLHVVNYDVYKAQAQDYAKEIEKINKDLADDPNNMKLIERKQELIKAQQDAIANAEQEKQAIKSLIKDGIDAQLDALQKLIDKYKDSLQATADLYNYQKSISEKTSNIASIQKQINAYSGDNSEETQSKIQQLQQSLKDAKSDLEDTEYQQYLSDQEQLLDTFYDETEEWLNSRLDDLDGLIQQVIDDTNANSGNISQTITDTTNGVGYTLTGAMATIWGTTDTNLTNNLGSVSNNITGAIGTIGSGLQNIGANTNNAVNGIKGLVQQLVDDAKKRAEAEEAARKAAEAAKKAAEEAKKKAEEAAKQKTPTVPTGGTPSGGGGNNGGGNPSNGSGSSSGGNSGGGNGAWGSWFIHQADSYPKNRLDINNSVVDRLKYRDIKSDFNTRKSYFYAMGGTGNYRGSASQNRWMVEQMKAHGYSKGGTIGSLIKGTGEDGFILARTGEEVLSEKKLALLRDALQYVPQNIPSMNITPTLPKFNGNQNINLGGITIGDINMNGVNDVETMGQQIRDTVSNDVRTQKFLKTFIYKDNNEYKKYR